MRPDLRAELDASRDELDHLVRLDVRIWERVVRHAVPDADSGTLLRTSIERAVDRYTAMLQEPDETPAVRRAVERAFELGVRLDPRRRRAGAG